MPRPIRRRRIGRAFIAAAGVVLAVLAAGMVLTGAPSVAASAPAPMTYRPPVPGPMVVLRGFDPVGTYEAGHRGVDLRTVPGGPVLAAGDGVVSFAGPVAGRSVVTITHADGIRTSYEPLVPAVATGQAVRAGQLIGTVSGTHGAFPPDVVVHWGARRGDVYLDPLSLLGGLGPVRLLPWRGS